MCIFTEKKGLGLVVPCLLRIKTTHLQHYWERAQFNLRTSEKQEALRRRYCHHLTTRLWHNEDVCIGVKVRSVLEIQKQSEMANLYQFSCKTKPDWSSESWLEYQNFLSFLLSFHVCQCVRVLYEPCTYATSLPNNFIYF